MNRFIIILAGILVLSCILLSCKDNFLESTPENGTFTDLNVFKDKEDFEEFMFGAYTEFQGAFDGDGITSWVLVAGRISQDIVLTDERPQVLESYITPGNSTYGFWRPLYKVIGRTNMLLQKLSVAPQSITQADKDLLEGEAKFLRGFAYFMLARAYGSIPMPLLPYESAQNGLQCTDEAQVWDQVISDLTDASAKLPRRADWGASNLGRATKGSALAFLANAYMYKKDWAAAAKSSQDLISLGDYGLLSDVRQVFSLQHENSEESVFEIQYRKVDNGNLVWNGQPNNGNLLGTWTSPRNIGDEYAPFGGWGGDVMNKKLADSFEPGDERRSKLVVAVGETYKGENMTEAVTIPATIAQNSSAFSTKYWLGPSESYLNGLNVPAMRYAEFLLNYSEILFELGQTNEAYAQLNKVRTRAKLPEKDPQTDKEIFMTALMNERRWELNFEPNLWWHYTRTGRAEAFLRNVHGVNFNTAWNKLPIPQADRDLNPNLCQNQGY